MKKETKRTFLLIVAGVVFALTIFSCKEEKATTAEIHVVDISGDPVSNAMVRLYGTSTTSPARPPIIDDTLYTNTNGAVIFNYTDHFNLGQAGFAVLDIEVVSETTAGVGIIKVEEEKTNSETVIIQ